VTIGRVYFNAVEKRDFALLTFILRDDSENEVDTFYDGLETLEELNNHLQPHQSIHVKLMSLEKGNPATRDVAVSYFEKHYVEHDEYIFQVDPRRNQGYANQYSEIAAPCPVCTTELELFCFGDHVICQKCNVSLSATEGDSHKYCVDLYEVKFITFRDDYTFSHYQRGSSRDRFLDLRTKFKEPDWESKNIWTCLFFFEKEVLKELQRRIVLIESVQTDDSLSQAGFIVELSSLVKFISKKLKIFGLHWNPNLRKDIAPILYAANHIRHLDEQDVELISTLQNYKSDGPRNLVFGLESWEYENFLSLKKSFGLDLIDTREGVIAELFQTIYSLKYKELINSSFFDLVEQNAAAANIQDSLRMFPWVKNLLG